ncbi:hypothetical protein [Propionivibrio sp.]|uniref:hypothetical protein n=1 Tax=Propionivibrio sp. TaxID=2212460 RepID=UPI0025EEB1F3|nr:hypothetical protein [Propionivibrio sp.]MBK7357517.1 hypothetical protein [Propionivibrio sp.]
MSTGGQALGGVVGAIGGFLIAGPKGALYGAQIGMAIGGYLDPPKGPHTEGPRLSDLRYQTSLYGAPIPRVYGTVAITGNVFWLENNQIRESSFRVRAAERAAVEARPRTRPTRTLPPSRSACARGRSRACAGYGSARI